VIGFSTWLPGPFGFIVAVVAALVLISAWIILAASRFVQGGVVERPERVPQLYGYTVCLVGLFWAVTSLLSIIENAMALSAPDLREASEFGWEPSVSSFEAFRATYDRARQMAAPDPGEAKLDSVPEPELRRRFEALRADRIRRVQFEARRSIITGALSLAIAAALFTWHWRWLRRRVGPWAALPAAGPEASRPAG
jgi:hypothetical protein